MTLPKGYLPKKGDELLIRATVKYDVDRKRDPDDPVWVHLKPVGGHNSFVASLDAVAGLHCRKWDVGAMVTSGEFEGTGEVIATHGTEVWVKDFEGDLWTVAANDLDLAPAGTMTEADLMAGLEPLIFPPPAPIIEPVPSDDNDIKF
jgi:hypothetical protein